MDFFYILTSGEAITDIFKNVISNERVNATIQRPYVFDSAICESMYKLCHGRYIGKLLRFIPIQCWRKYSSLLSINTNPQDNIYIIVAPGLKIDKEIDVELFDSVRMEGKMTLILMLFDSIDSLSPRIRKKIKDYFKCFDIVMTFDKKDALNYGIEYFELPSYKLNVEKINDKCDLFFVGNNKGRLRRLKAIGRKLIQRGVKCDFFIYSRYPLLIREKYIHVIHKRMEYSEVIRRILAADCILELMCEGQKTASLRYFEAITYSKKLLSDNPYLSSMPYYEPVNMKQIDDFDTIDVNWIKDKKNVEYKH